MKPSSILPLACALPCALPCAAAPCQPASFTNPILYEDYPDNDVSLGPDGAYYLSASNFHFSPGAPILRSEDLVHWEAIGHSLPRLDFGGGYDLAPGGERAYRGGTWASTLRYRESNGLWYWIGCTNFWNTWVFTAPAVTGPWDKASQMESGLCFYDNGLLIDDDDTMYVVYGSDTVSVAQLDEDGLLPVRTEVVFTADDANVDAIEGNRMYKINGLYYILNDRPGGTTIIWKAESPFGPYQHKVLVENVAGPVEGGNSPHQGSLVETPDGDWYFMSFTWAYPAGRMPVLAPVTWGDDGFPVFVPGGNGGWGVTYPVPLRPAVPTPDWLRTYTFEGPDLEPTFEWNHNPDVSSYEVNNGVTLFTATVTEDIYSARNTLTHRIHGEFPVGTVEIDFSSMHDGDRAGFAAFRDQSAYIGIHRDGDTYTLTAKHGMIMDEWSSEPVSPGSIAAEQVLPADTTRIWFRQGLDARASGTRDCDFSYSLDGEAFETFGPTYELYDGWAWFIAYRYGIFNFATKAMGGSIEVKSLVVA
ncbi:Non-reducing end alpha-L-arabinofuranosidase BoGH43B 1 [Emericellopsis cladophorae]|uniref:Non-reducing end alpha-L-arabinofuranosidase BoGH43B 1 n=1 Tax=Emericellopsis cladophorae TaxID=2686198 RepID=A0A9Q0BBM0_9HYPO|nr:Non-reducing end alpha-L-arabinofuranosidase BoGH43B 1 [Emericellopsis cladophorae]KAI6778640.1 Non-reducing end alpha-L-arabinofuranosidase BoGH43B 1 [Emericellopsis cladophorae]